MSKIYDFKEQLEIGQQGEAFLDNYFKERGVIVEIKNDMTTQRKGIDRIFHVPRHPGTKIDTYTVEYKTDYAATKTGNAFMEMVVDKKAGWVMKTEADYLVYYVPERGIYLVKPATLRSNVGKWINQLPWREIANKGFVAYGMLLPLKQLEQISVNIYEL